MFYESLPYYHTGNTSHVPQDSMLLPCLPFLGYQHTQQIHQISLSLSLNADVVAHPLSQSCMSIINVFIWKLRIPLWFYAVSCKLIVTINSMISTMNLW
jgi:hypothetical protein